MEGDGGRWREIASLSPDIAYAVTAVIGSGRRAGGIGDVAAAASASSRCMLAEAESSPAWPTCDSWER